MFAKFLTGTGWTLHKFANILGGMTDLTPLGGLLEGARKKSGLSQNEAARRAGITGTTWRNIIRGYAGHGGTPVPYDGKPKTVADMAQAVGVQSFQLRDVGRADAANALHDIELAEKFDGMATQEIEEKSKALATELREMLERQGRDVGARQRRVLDRWARTLLETLDEFDAENNAS
jgi:transcriptional regulator with XRE-family HTH domain